MFGFTATATVQFWQKVKTFFRESLTEKPTHLQTSSSLELSHSRVKISFEDLKLISGALLYFRKHLTAKGEIARAESVAELDRRLYHFIQDAELKQEVKERENEQVAA
jgi:uncharacterized protein YjbK